MLGREFMGLLALGVLWVNAALVLAVAFHQLANVRALARRMAKAKARGELVRGVVESCEGGRIAVRRIRQIGRAMTTKGPDRILFTDGPQSFEVLGGIVRTDDGATVTVEPAQPAESEVWIDEARAADGVSCRDAAAFDEAWRPASTFKGFARDVELEVRTGDRVWVVGVRRGDRVGAGEGVPLLVSMVDPFAFCASRTWLLVGFLAGSAAALVAVTALALWPPHFGLVSTIGGALCVVYFLGIQPIGTAVRDAVKTPARRLVGARWQRPAPSAGERAAAA